MNQKPSSTNYNKLILVISILIPVVVAVIEGNNAVATTRQMVGATKSFEAEPGSIRGDFGLGFTENIIHASDSLESFEKEVNVVFK